LPKSSSRSAFTARWRAFSFSFGATESSRSRNTRSASDAAALAIIFSLEAGVDSSERRRRVVTIDLLGSGRDRRQAPPLRDGASSGYSELGEDLGGVLPQPRRTT